MSIATEIAVIVLLAAFNGVLAMSEIALVSSRKVRLIQRAEVGDRGAEVALKLAGDPGRFLSTIQIGITLVGILAGVFGGATLAGRVADWLARWPALAQHGEPIAMAVVVLGITYLTLVVGELVPKQLALASPEAIAARVARPLAGLASVARPLVFVLDRSSRLLLRLLPRQSERLPITEEELQHLLEQGTRAGVFEAGEQEIVARVLRLGERRVGELATPRGAIVALDLEADPKANLERIASNPHTHFPVYDSRHRRLVGVVSIQDLLRELAAGHEPDLGALVRDPLYLPGSISALRALERIRSTGRHVAVVLDEHGGIGGMLTLHDLLEAIVGALPTGAEGRPLVVQQPDGSWSIDGLLDVGELARMVGIERIVRESPPQSHTVGGVVMEQLGRLPEVGDRFDWHGLRFEVAGMDGRRVDRVNVTPVELRGDLPSD